MATWCYGRWGWALMPCLQRELSRANFRLALGLIKYIIGLSSVPHPAPAAL